QGFVRMMQEELKVDCIDINKYAMAKWRKELTQIIDDEEFIQNAQINVQVKMHIRNTGVMK
ncbi:MAG: Ger(x)C family spore germination C-terminal domain-containing protein, partial [Syntrophomonadaceae bacterium]|nr:Ger(x)C family spore germination C-terminal domain-containing protein [Syntrophomonadaceae bacterium]